MNKSGRGVVQVVLKCSDCDSNLNLKNLYVETTDGNPYGFYVSYCSGCDSYMTKDGMESDLDNLGLKLLQEKNPEYRSDDIAKVRILE